MYIPNYYDWIIDCDEIGLLFWVKKSTTDDLLNQFYECHEVFFRYFPFMLQELSDVLPIKLFIVFEELTGFDGHMRRRFERFHYSIVEWIWKNRGDLHFNLIYGV